MTWSLVTTLEKLADTLSRKSSMTLAHIRTAYVPLLLNLKTMGISLDYDECGALIVSFMVNQIRGKQMQDNELVREVHKIMNGEIGENFCIT